MKRISRVAAFASLLVLVVLLAAPAMATESPDEGAETSTTVAEPVQISEGDQPSIVIPPIGESHVEQPWTARFIYPGLVVGTIVLILGIAIGYNRSIRSRYRVVA